MRNRVFQAPGGFWMQPDDDDGTQFEIWIPYLEPFMYACWMVPLNLCTCKLLAQIPLFGDNDMLLQHMFSLNATTLILSLIMDPLPAIVFLEFNRSYSLTSHFYNHHIAALEGLAVSQVSDFIMSTFKVAPEIRLGSLLSTFFLTFTVRHLRRRNGRASSLIFDFGQYFLMIMIY